MSSNKNTFYTVRCSNKECPSRRYGRKGRRDVLSPDGQWLGEIQVDVPNTSKHRCHLCNTTFQHDVLPDGTVIRQVVVGKTIIPEMIARIEVVPA